MGSNNFWVDPDGLERQGTPYHRAAADFRTLSGRIDEILRTYPDAFGGDELGEKFRAPFMKGVAGIQGRINLVADRLQYTGDGLVSNGRDFRQAEDDATEVSRRLRLGIEARHAAIGDSPPQETPAHRAGLLRPFSRSERPAELTPHLVAGRLEQGKLLPREAAERPAQTQMGLRMPGIATERANPGTPVERGYLTSSFIMSADWYAGPLTIDGSDVPEGYQLLGANEVTDGKVRMTVDGYQAVVPLSGGDVQVGGRPIDVPEGTQLFLVKEGPQTEPPPYQERTYVEFDRDGTAVQYRPKGS
jgi:hypothetical protein